MRLPPLLFAVLLLFGGPLNAAVDFGDHPEVESFIDRMVEEHNFQRGDLQHLFEQTEHRQSIIDAITRPAEGKPWHDYRPIFLTEKRINGGVKFWRQHAELLKRAEQEYGVPPQIITAIIGVETFYGRHRGTYRVVDALATLGFDYPPRGGFFRRQLEEFLLMAREEQRDPLDFKGSYAGAMGQPQFIPSSFRAYAVDFDGDGRRDLWDNPADIIGSVANYFHRHRWQEGQPVARRATLRNSPPQSVVDNGMKPAFTVAQLRSMGVTVNGELPGELEAALLELEGSKGAEYWVTLDNFYVISRYNHSPLYSMAVYQLSEAIRTTRGR